MTDKRKKRARAIQAKTGIPYASAINQLKNQLEEEVPQEARVAPEEPSLPWPYDSENDGLRNKELTALRDFWFQGPDDPLMVQKLAEEFRDTRTNPKFEEAFEKLAAQETLGHAMFNRSYPSRNIRPYRPKVLPSYDCIAIEHLGTLQRLTEFREYQPRGIRSLLVTVNLINQGFEDLSKDQHGIVFFGDLAFVEGGINPLTWNTTCETQLIIVSSEQRNLIKGLFQKPPYWLREQMSEIKPRPELRDWEKNPPPIRPPNSCCVVPDPKSEYQGPWGRFTKVQVAPLFPAEMKELCHSVLTANKNVLEQLPPNLRIGYATGLCIHREPQLDLTLLTACLRHLIPYNL